MKPKTKNKIPPQKLKEVKELIELIKTKKTILLSSIKNIPASQFQEIGKKLRGKAIIKFPKKNLIFRAIDSSGNEELKKLKDYVKESPAILFSNLDSFELAGELVKNKSPAKAKAGQEAPIDIEIEAGPTNLTPGPAISELGALGIQIQINKGKILIRASKVIAKKGEKISQGAVDIMNKLEIKPFSIGFIPISSFDTQENKIYSEINIDIEGSLADLKECFAKALAFAVAIEYPTEESIKFLIAKAAGHERALNLLSNSPEENKVEEGN